MISVVGVIVIAAVIYGILRFLRTRHSNPKYIPGRFLKERWTRWGTHGRGTYEPARVAEPTANIGTRTTAAANASTNNQGSNSSRVDRNTSIRSIMTLPPYRLDPTNTEQVIGREGERDGVDVVIEMPTEEALETLREEEMESLYQIRLARRQQNEERERRREIRRLARELNDPTMLDALRSGNLSSADRAALDELRADHQRLKNERRGAVPSVSYADVGVARHDGTRIRANSTESERVGLLSDAASMGERTSTQLRGRSDSAMSVNTDFPSPSLHRSRANSTADSTRLSMHTRGGSTSDVGEADVGESAMPLHSPPGYEDPEEGRSTTPTAEPPPSYPGRDPSPAQLTPSTDDESAQEVYETTGTERPRSGVDGTTPQLPSLRLGRVPRIVIEPSQDQSLQNQGSQDQQFGSQ